MSQGAKTQWILKNRDGIVTGPFSTEVILQKISQGELTGDEYISVYPNSDWHLISTDAQFYDKLLDFLEGDKINRRDTSSSEDVKPERTPSRLNFDDSKTPTPPPSTKPDQHQQPVRNRAERVSSSAPPPNEKEKSREKKRRDTEPEGDSEVIELKKLKKVVKKKKIKRSIMPMVVSLIALCAAAYLLLPEEETKDDRVRLLPLQKSQQAASAQVSAAKLKEGTSYFERDDLQGYLAAQNSFVQAYEADSRSSGTVAFICLTYLELWPNAYQDSQDLQTVLTATQAASAIDPASAEAAICKVVDLFIRGRYIEAGSITETALETYGEKPVPLGIFYFFKARLLENSNELDSAQSYMRSAEQNLPKWLRLYSYEGYLLTRLKRFEDATKRFKQILQVNPRHAPSLIELGLVELNHFKNIPQAENLLRQGLASPDRAPREVTSRGYLGLSEIALQKGQSPEALKLAQKSYSLSSTNLRAKEIIVKLGGDKKLRETKIVDAQLVYEGDQLVREGDCSSAQAHYKAAFQVNPRNGIAAMKAAECLWQGSLTSEAIDWLNRAIKADSNLIDAYVMQADFFSRRYNFQAAAQILARANQVRPNHYKVFRGLAMVELRRLNAKAAVQNAERARQLYEGDVESYVILAKAHIQLKEYSDAFSAASKATEIDVNNRQAQIVLANAMVGVQGMPAALETLNRLVNVYPMITEYRLALGDLYLKDQSYPAAETVFEQVTRIDTNKPKEAWLKLGIARQAQGKHEPALTAYFTSAELDPSDPEPLLQAGLLYLEWGKPIDARLQFNRVLKINKDYPLVNYYVGRAALMNGSAEEALKSANEEKQRNPNLADSYLLAADAYVALEQYSLCASEYREAIKLRPQGTITYVKMARCFRLAGNIDAAFSMIENAGKRESGEPEVWKEKGLISEARGEAVKAIEAYQQYLMLAPRAADRPQIQSRIEALSR
jgi:tetratricopeptide (TPR) repeat protein